MPLPRFIDEIDNRPDPTPHWGWWAVAGVIIVFCITTRR